MRVIIEDRPLRKALTGVGNYIAQLLRHLPEFSPDIFAEPFMHTHLIRRDWRRQAEPSAPPPPPPMKRTGGLRVPWIVRSTLQAGYDTLFRLKTRGYDLYHEPNHVPIRSSLPTITTIHDLSVLVHPQWHPADRVKWYEKSFAAGVRQSRHLLAASEFTKREIIRVLGVPADRITVTYQAARDSFLATGVAVRRGEIPALPDGVLGSNTRMPEKFFLFVGTLEPRKNVEGLLDAFAALPYAIRDRHRLLIAGAWGWKAEQIRSKLADRKLGEHVHLLGYLHDPQLAALYARCTAFVWPSWYEGFGLPPIEALACGAPVLVSDVSSLPEVVGNAGVLLPPDDIAAWTFAMKNAAAVADARDDLNLRAFEQASRFSWKRFVMDTVAGYQAALRK